MKYEHETDMPRKDSNAVTQKAEREMEIDARVEQKMIALMFKREEFIDGFLYGFMVACFIGGLVWLRFSKNGKLN